MSQDPKQLAGATAAYWEERLETLPGLHGVGFATYGQTFNEWMYRVRKRVFLKHVAELPIQLSKINVLDVGSGTGFWVEAWKSLGVKALTASDLTNVASERLRALYPGCRVQRLDISSEDAVEILDDRYDLISAIDVLFHITSDDAYTAALSNISRALKPGGYFLFSENLPHHGLPRSNTQVNRTLEKVSELLASVELRIVKRVPMFVLMNRPFDTRWQHAAWFWGFFMKPLVFLPWLGNLYGAMLYPLECLLLHKVAEGPSTEFIICQKVQNI